MASNSITPSSTTTTNNNNPTILPTSTTSITTTTNSVSPARPISTTTPQPQLHPPLLSHPRPPQLQRHQQQQQQQQQPQPHITLFPSQTQTQTQTHLRSQISKPSPSSDPTVLYPLVSTGRGLLPTPIPGLVHPPLHDPRAANPIAYPPRATGVATTATATAGHLIRGPFLHPNHNLNHNNHTPSVSLSPAGVRGLPLNPHYKASSSPCSAPDSNGLKDPTEKGRDDTFITVRDRKVRISDGASMYALCRSWLRNGYPEESQPHYGDFVKSLPRPSPMPTSESSSPKEKESDEKTEAEEEEKPVENLHVKELLRVHIKRAKKVRARLREERSQRIERYKTRLALLLPPLMGNDTS